MRVLVVDDHPAYLAACVAVLSADGHHVVAAGSFEEGRRALAEDHFDAVIADVRLGAYNGLHLITLAAPATVKVAISAFPDRVLQRDAEQVGARFLVKPANVAALSALLGPQDTSAPTPTPRRNESHVHRVRT